MIDYNVLSGIITLTTDFGLTDHYVGVMKGVIASINSDARVVDLCHEVPAFGIAEGAFTIAQSYGYFPEGTVHVVVVDPGVGGARRAIVAQAAGHYFVAPDNGVLSQVYERAPHQVRAIDVERYALKRASRTFHGRDIFAPAAARLAGGEAMEDFGAAISDYVRLASTLPQQVESGRWRATILKIDRFGNLVTSIPAELFQQCGGGFRLLVGKLEVGVHAETYEVADEGKPFVIIGSSEYVEVSVSRKSASELAAVKVGDCVELILS